MDSAYMSFGGSQNATRSQSVDVVNYNDIFVDSSPTRQQRLLQSRNARFPAKKLSISSLSSKLTQLISNSEQDEPENTARKENKLHKSRSVGTINRKTGLSILEEISNSTKSRGQRRRPDIPIFQDNPERPLLESSPGILSSPPGEVDSNEQSPANFDHIKDSLNEMRLRDISINERWSPLIPSPSTGKTKTRKRSGQTSFDADEYIEHIEKELQQVREEAYSPLTRRPMKEKLRAAIRENEILQKELAQLKDKFEAEVKKTVEHKTATEFELRRKVRDLEDVVEQKDHLVRELQYQHEEKRLDSNVFESLKATIEKLEQDNLEMEEINFSMNKRNEVLTQLLAMSPTKIASGFNLGSPIKEKRNGRPTSMIIPRQSASPGEIKRSPLNSLACSPLSLSVEISPLKLSSLLNSAVSSPEEAESDAALHVDETRSPVREAPNRRWTTYADLSGAFLNATDEKPTHRRKARKFVAGSRQLKPLLLPTLNGDNTSLASSSAASSPRFSPRYSASENEQDDTVLAAEPHSDAEELSLDTTLPQHSPEASEDGSPGPACLEDQINASIQAEQNFADSEGTRQTNEPYIWQSHDRNMSFFVSRNGSGDSLQAMPMPSTPESLVTMPRALFSEDTRPLTIDSPSRTHVRSMSSSASPQAILNLRKRRKASASPSGQSPAPKIQRLERRHSSAQYLSPLLLAETPSRPGPATSMHQRLSNVRSHDNVVELLRQKNFAVKPLATMTIRTAYKILSICTSTLRDFKSKPFALARRMLANAWYMHWKLLGKVSWWVLGLFIQPQHIPRTRSPIDWDHYDGESIAQKYCDPSADEASLMGHDIEHDRSEYLYPEHNQADPGHNHVRTNQESNQQENSRPGWGQSLYLWGKFSAALLLAVGGAVVRGPGEMLKDLPTTSCSCCPAHTSAARGCRRFRKHHSDQTSVQQETHNAEPDSRHRHGRAISHLSQQSNHSAVTTNEYMATEQWQSQDADSTLRPPLPPRQHIDAIFLPPAVQR